MTLKTAQSPMMMQWSHCKKKAKDALLLFRLGDFYEAFYDDAKLLSEAVDVMLTQRQGIPMSGVPAHAAEGYIEKLVEKGHLVAIAEQIEDAKGAKGLVKRDVVRVISPGTILSSLPENDNNFFACLSILNKTYALALLDISTGELRFTELSDIQEMEDELSRRAPSEVLISEKDFPTFQKILENLPLRVTKKEAWHFDPQMSFKTLTEHFKVHNLDGFGLQGMPAAVTALGTLLFHIQEDLRLGATHITSMYRDELSSFMAIDQATQKNLELIKPLHSEGKNSSLLKLLDLTQTPMGSRLLKAWLTHPLLSPKEIEARQESVEELRTHLEMQNSFKQIRDLERLMMRISNRSASPRDLITLKVSLEAVPSIERSLSALSSPLIKSLPFPDLACLAQTIDRTLVEDPPVKLGEGRVIQKGIDETLDELRSLRTNSQTWIANYQAELKELTGIKTLKIIFSKAFGYCIEVSRGQADKMPANFERRQTLVNNERFVSMELKSYEQKIFSAEEKIHEIERRIFSDLLNAITLEIEKVLSVSKTLATLDVLLAFAKAAKMYRFTRPLVDESSNLHIQVGRHPVIENSLIEESFIPNDTDLNSKRHLLLITGPNMAGKSTYIRQVAILTIMAQIGSFIPAKKAHLGVVDKVFSRIGASDDLSRGQSTFMIEMTETANILRNSTERSLVILDEIGRGTSTFDGISIAWAVAEHLLKVGAKTLFATHYWELTELEKDHEGAANVHVAVQEAADQIVFLRKIVEGSTDKSYGIHVARLAGLPQTVLKRAHSVLFKLEEKELDTPSAVKQEQLSFFTPPSPKDEALEELGKKIESIDVNQMTPMEALLTIQKWKDDLS